ncbi:DUF2058 domain-containing protein [Pokkaliibacter sp. CJK22405]|uniref:DUF2058 domain-containing protein n=1 Tax=Pokkaliibacter sp. CJK22405 TaxID=3384615 RepID=UPI003985504C
MASLKDQLLKSGLASKQQAQKAATEKRKASKQSKQVSKQEQVKAQLEAEQQREQERQAKLERDRQLNQDNQADKAHRALMAEVRQLAEVHGVKPPADAETPYQFVHGTKIKKIYVLPKQYEQLAREQLVICDGPEGYVLVPAKEAERIEARAPDKILRPHKAAATEEEDYPAIPDDLMW